MASEANATASLDQAFGTALALEGSIQACAGCREGQVSSGLTHPFFGQPVFATFHRPSAGSEVPELGGLDGGAGA